MRATQPLQRSIRRLALTTKQAGKDYYKGTGTGSMGRHTKHGGYVIDWKKVRTYVCPDLSRFDLTPFVVESIKVTKEDWSHTKTNSPMDGEDYLRKWKEAGGNM